MKKSLLITLICAFLVFGLSPLRNAANNPGSYYSETPPAQTQTRAVTASRDVAERLKAKVPPAKTAHQLPNQQPGAEANSTAPGKQVSVAALPKTPTLLLKAKAEDDERDEPFSDIDPVTLRELKRRAFAPQQNSASIDYSAKQDDVVATSRTDRFLNIESGLSVLNPLQSFAGVTNSDQLDSMLHKPPDPNMAAGPNHIMIVVNSLFAIYSKSGTLLSKRSLKSWFNNVCSGCDVFDPRIAYDPGAGRWIMIALYRDKIDQSKVLISLSQTSDPTGSWWIYSLNGVLDYSGEKTWADYPDVGFDGIPTANGGAIYITVNQFTFSATPSFRTALLFMLPKSSLYAGASVNYWRAYDKKNSDNTQAFTLRASKTYGNPGGEFLISTRNNGSTASLWRVNPTYPPTAIDFTLQSSINVGSYSLAPDATQPGTTDSIDTMDNRMYNAVWQNDRIYAAFTEAHDWGGGTVAALRYLKINTVSNSAEINETFGANGLHYYSPTIATDNSDNIVVVFSRSGPGENAGARYAGRLTTDTTLQSSASLKAGTASLLKTSDEDKNRWGDYQGAAMDPADGSKVWIYGEYAVDLAGSSNDFDWGTWIGQVQFSGSPPPPPPPPAPTASAATSVTSSGFNANWSSSTGATGYRLDVSTSNTFASFISGYQDLDVGNVLSRAVSGLSANTTYYYRVRAYNGGGPSGNSGTITVTTAQSSKTLQFSTSNYSVGEGNQRVTITVTRSGDASGTATIDYRTTDTDTFTVGCADTVNNLGSAYARCDFATVVGTLSFAAGEASKTFFVPIIDDSYAEGNETFSVVLSNPTGGTLGSPSTATVTINDNETVNGTNPMLATNSAGVTFFVRQHYLDFLGREPEVGEPWSPILNGCANQFNTDPNSPSAGCDRITVSGAFFGSPEFKNKGIYVIDFYRVAFNRLPTYAEFAQDLASITGVTAAEANAKRAAFANSFVLRSEFVNGPPNAYGAMSNSTYATTLMGRYSLSSITTPDPANPDGTAKVTLTTNDLINRLNGVGGTLTRAQVLRAIVQSDEVTLNFEAVNAFVASQYYGYLRRTPDTGGFNGWVTYLRNNPSDFRTMVNGFMNSIEYRLRFGPP